MTFVAARCPQCGGELQLDNQKEAGFCMHCGTKIIVQDAIRAVKIDNTHMVDKWMKMGDLAAESNNQSEAYDYYTKIAEVDPENWLALFKKGRAAGWQSTLANPRFTEAATCFGQAINLAPESEKQDLMQEAAQEMKSLGLALMALRSERFVKWPDQDEANGFLQDVNSIMNAVLQLRNKSGFLIPGVLEPIAERIQASVEEAWLMTIKPDYIGDENHPSKYEFDQFIDRVGYCTTLIEKIIDFSDEDDDQDIKRYELLMKLHKEAIESCSWDYEILSWGKSWHKEYQLTDSAKQYRKSLISEYNTKISQLKVSVQKQKEVKKQQEAEAAGKRFEEYWAEHGTEKSQLEEERQQISEQIRCFEKDAERLIEPFVTENSRIQTRIEKIRNEQKALGLFKVKEKKVLQDQIDAAQKEINANLSRMKDLQSPINGNIDRLMGRMGEIDHELTKPR